MMETGGPSKQNGLDWFCGPHLVLGGYELAGGHSAAENERHVGPARALSRAGRERLPPKLSPRCRRARERAGAPRRHSRGVATTVMRSEKLAPRLEQVRKRQPASPAATPTVSGATPDVASESAGSDGANPWRSITPQS